ncbi:hypothetical protein L8W69_01850 [Campylobacter sp. CNRCH_2016_3089]|uniref:hypothetical protein n=1 Tax=Campylobacter sp. CNRCH_2016_3089 TaxID=2911609 RepID=UPI0021E69148|nr:hypothetical protein [Campylobacter sp. CNRCH_2016_3089]MCV3507973.1 hypothetical protein [Campylobacter sp. CNRCH_2016_3089]
MSNRIVEFFDVSSICFEPYLTDKRQPQRPSHLRQKDFDQNYDYGIIFVDIFYDISEKKIHCIGAPLYHMTDLVSDRNISFLTKFSLLKRRKHSNIEIQTIEIDRVSHTVINYNSWLKPEFLQFNIYGKVNVNLINDNNSCLLEDKRVVLLKNKDNQLRWIKDYCDYYQKIHNADIVLIYDSSEEYSSLELLEYLRNNTSISIVVVRWPVPYGPMKYENSNWDSDYSMYLMFEHAKYRFLQTARSVLYVDIDELVLSKNNQSIFEEAENTNEPLYFNGEWIVNTTLEKEYSFKDLCYLDRRKGKAVVKWCLGLNGDNRSFLADCLQWRVHDHYSHALEKSLRNNLNTNFETRHFLPITSGWRSKNRYEVVSLDENLVKDERLILTYKKLGWIS